LVLLLPRQTCSLAEGERVITIVLNFSSNPNKLKPVSNSHLYDAFKVMFSGEKEWIEPITEKTSSGKYMDPVVLGRIFDFLNSAKTAADIAGIEPVEGPVFDDPTTGYGDQIRDYDIGLTTAGKILEKRSQLGSAGFTSIDQVRAVKGIGEDKINDLLYSFGNPVHSTTVDHAKNRIIIKRTITKAQKAIVAYDKAVLSDLFDTKWPVVKILLNTDSKQNPFIYKLLKDLAIGSASIEVDVKEARDLIVQNDQSVLDPGKPYQPFGNRPLLRANFYVGSWEIFQKSINKLYVNIVWHGLPDDSKGFEEYYKAYIPKDIRKNESFLASTHLLDGKVWRTVSPQRSQLFANKNGEPLSEDNQFQFTATGIGNTIGGIKREVDLDTFKKFDQNTKKGFLRFSMDGVDFGHKDYQASYTKAVLSEINIDVSPPVGDYSNGLPKEPYTPTIKELWIDYKATEQLSLQGLKQEEYKNRIEQFFHVYPFGAGEVKTSGEPNYLLPQFNDEGSLYLGIKDLQPLQNLSVLFQVSEGSSDPKLLPPELVWSYLTEAGWKVFADQNILADTSNGLMRTGHIIFSIPSDVTNKNSILTTGLYWLKVTANTDSGAIPRLIGIRCQAAMAVFDDNNNSPDHYGTPLPEKTISKLAVADSDISKIEQPFTSFNGKMQEESSAFYTRISERLRHKKRALLIWDYERLVLEEFNSIYKVKCMNHTRFEGDIKTINEAAPGHVSLIVVTNIRNKNAVDPLRPRTSLSTLREIEEFVKKRQPPCVKLYVQNPAFEEVMVDFKVRFHQGFDKGLSKKKLNEAIIEYLSPWAFEQGSDIVFGGSIHGSMILNFVEQQEYVDYVTCFNMFHIIPGDTGILSSTKVEEAMASTSASVLGSASYHDISVLETDDCECEENEVVTSKIVEADDCPCDK
jgi:hypothetical protein